MIRIQNLLRADEIDRVVAPLRPGERDQPVDVRPRHGVFGGGRRHALQPVELAQRFLSDIVGHAGRVDLPAQFIELARVVVGAAEFLLNRLELLAEEVLALVLADLGLDLRLDLRTDLEHFELFDQQPVQVLEASPDIERVENLLLDRRGERVEAGRNEIRQPSGITDVRRERREIVGQHRRELHHLLERGAHVALECVDFNGVVELDDGRGFGHGRAQERLGRHHAVQANTRQALHDEPQAAVGQLEHLVNVRERAGRMQIGLARFFGRRVELRKHPHRRVGRDGLVDQLDGALPRNGEGHEGIGEQHRVA